MNFLSYIQGKRYGEEAHRLEKEALGDPFMQDAIDGYDRVNDRPSYHLKRLEKRLTKRTKRTFYLLRFWGIVAAFLIIICLSILFFLNSRVNVLRDTAFLEIHTDGVISNYKTDSVQYAKDSVIQTNQSAYNRIVQPEKTEKLKANGEVAQDVQNNMPEEEPGQYTLSNEETQALLLDGNKSEEISKPADNPAQSQTQIERIQTQAQQIQTQTPKPEKGSKAYDDYIAQNRRQLSDANLDNQHGKVILMFHVNKQGRPIEVAILRSLCPAADKEAVRLLQNGPDWTVSDLLARLEVAF